MPLPVGAEVGDLAAHHAGDRRRFQPPHPARLGAHSASSPVSSTKTSSSVAARTTASSGTTPSSARSEPTIAIAGPAGRTRRPVASALGPQLGEALRRRVDLGGLAAGVLGDQVGRAAAADHLALRHHRDLVGEALGLLDVVGRHQDRRAAGFELADQGPELGADLRVEPDGRLVEQDQLRLVDEAAGEQQAAAHPAGELVDGVAAAVAQAGQVEAAVDRGADVLDPVEAGVDGEVVLDGDVDVEVVELGDDAHLGPGRLRVAGQLVAQHPQLAGVGDRLPGQQPHRRRLAGAVGPEQAEADALRHVEVEPVDRRDRAEALDDAAEFDCRHGADAFMPAGSAAPVSGTKAGLAGSLDDGADDHAQTRAPNCPVPHPCSCPPPPAPLRAPGPAPTAVRQGEGHE